MTELTRLHSPAAVLAALDEFQRLGRSAFLQRYGFGRSREYFVKDPHTGQLCDSKAIVGAAYGFQFPEKGPLGPVDFSGGEATVEARLRALGFEVVRRGEDWSAEEVAATLAAYFEMLRLEARQEPYRKTAFNEAVRSRCRNRSKASVELKFQNISAVLHGLDLPFIPGYKPRANAQLLLRKAVGQYVSAHAEALRRIIDALEEVRTPAQRPYRATPVEPPPVETVIQASGAARPRLPRKVDYAARDEANRALGRAGEQWVLDYEQRRLADEGQPELFQRVEWVSERLGDGTGFDILSFDAPGQARYIEVKTTNGAHASPFIISRNELAFSQESGSAFHLYRVFQFRQEPALYILRGDISLQVHLEALDYRASFTRLRL